MEKIGILERSTWQVQGNSNNDDDDDNNNIIFIHRYYHNNNNILLIKRLNTSPIYNY